MERGSLSRGLLVVWICLLPLVPEGAGAAPILHVTYQSDPGDPIGLGQSGDVVFTQQNSSAVGASQSSSLGQGQLPTAVDIVGGTVPSTLTILRFSSSVLNTPLLPAFYPDARDFQHAQPNHPILSIGLLGAFLPQVVTGSFTVTDAVYVYDAIQNTYFVQRFAATFEQHANGGAPALRGSVVFSAPEPSLAGLLLAGLLTALGRRRRSSR